MRIVSIGELLWDVFADSERIGGAPFNFAAHARRLGHNVLFLSAVGDDARGAAAIEELTALGLDPEFIQRVPDAATGTVTVQLDSEGRPTFTIHRPAAYDRLRFEEPALRRICSPPPDWIYYGTLHQAASAGRGATQRLIAALPGARRFYDVNLRPGCYTAALVEELLKEAHVVKLNEEEAAVVGTMFGQPTGDREKFCRRWSARFGWQALCVTRGPLGCSVLIGDRYAESPGYPVSAIDTVGAGDAFAAAFLHGLAREWSPEVIGDFANRVAALVASRPGAVPDWTLEECETLSRAGT